MGQDKIGIIGAGPVGSIMAAYLSRNGKTIFLADVKKDLISAISEKGITITGIKNIFTARVSGTANSAASLMSFDPAIIFVAVKLNYLDSVLDEIKPFFKAGQKIILLQNGIDNEELTAKKFKRDDILRFVINYAGMPLEPGTFKLSFFNPPNFIGALSPKSESLAEETASSISRAGLETIAVTDIKKYEWKKTILNSAMMPVCTATGLTMKQAMETEEARFLCEQILRECILVAQKAGYEYGSHFFDQCLDYLGNAGNHKPSTLLDLEGGKPIEYIFQAILDYGEKTGTPTPYLESLTKVIRVLERRKRLGK